MRRATWEPTIGRQCTIASCLASASSSESGPRCFLLIKLDLPSQKLRPGLWRILPSYGKLSPVITVHNQLWPRCHFPDACRMQLKLSHWGFSFQLSSKLSTAAGTYQKRSISFENVYKGVVSRHVDCSLRYSMCACKKDQRSGWSVNGYW